jgi:hypothetical protein
MSERRPQLRETGREYPAPNSLDEEDCLTLRGAVKGLAPEWSVDVHRDPVGEVSLMIMPPDVDDAIGPLLVVHKVASIFHLDQFRWDNYSAVGEYPSFDGVLYAVTQTLLALPSVCGSAITLH